MIWIHGLCDRVLLSTVTFLARRRTFSSLLLLLLLRFLLLFQWRDNPPHEPSNFTSPPPDIPAPWWQQSDTLHVYSAVFPQAKLVRWNFPWQKPKLHYRLPFHRPLIYVLTRVRQLTYVLLNGKLWIPRCVFPQNEQQEHTRAYLVSINNYRVLLSQLVERLGDLHSRPSQQVWDLQHTDYTEIIYRFLTCPHVRHVYYSIVFCCNSWRGRSVNNVCAEWIRSVC